MITVEIVSTQITSETINAAHLSFLLTANQEKQINKICFPKQFGSKESIFFAVSLGTNRRSRVTLHILLCTQQLCHLVAPHYNLHTQTGLQCCFPGGALSRQSFAFHNPFRNTELHVYWTCVAVKYCSYLTLREKSNWSSGENSPGVLPEQSLSHWAWTKYRLTIRRTSSA